MMLSSGENIPSLFYSRFRLLMNIPFLINIVLLIFFCRGPIAKYIILGSLFLTIGSMISILYSTFQLQFSNNEFQYTIIYTQIGILLEVFCFSSILGYKRKLIMQENEDAQKQLILQLKANSDLNEKLTLSLKSKIDTQSALIDKEKDRAMKAEYERQLTEVKSKMLRSRMNPHFIFNCLNSIDRYVLTNQPDKASIYLTKFARLMRNTLDYSSQSSISLEDELNNLNIYIQLEQLRFNDKFEYVLEVNNDIDIKTLKIPPLTLQPYVENAIWHGLMHVNHTGILKITIYGEDKEYWCSIDDNGIGRESAAKIRSLSATKRKSEGAKITAERLRLNDKLFGDASNIKTIDKFDTHGNPTGTKVIIHLPKGKMESILN